MAVLVLSPRDFDRSYTIFSFLREQKSFTFSEIVTHVLSPLAEILASLSTLEQEQNASISFGFSSTDASHIFRQEVGRDNIFERNKMQSAAVGNIGGGWKRNSLLTA